MIVADHALHLQGTEQQPPLAASLANLARELQSEAPHPQRLNALRNFMLPCLGSPIEAQQRAIANSLICEYLAARYISDPVTTANTLAVEISEKPTVLEHHLRRSLMHTLLHTIQHCLDLHGHVQQLREKCAVAFLHAYITRQRSPSSRSLTAMPHSAVHEELRKYQRFIFARDAVGSATPRSLATVRMMGDTDAPLHLGRRAPSTPQTDPLQQRQIHPGSDPSGRPNNILSLQLTGQIFKMYARRTGRVPLANRMENQASTLQARLTYLQGFIGGGLLDAGQGGATLIRIYAGVRYFSDPLSTPSLIAQELGCDESLAQASLDAMDEYCQLRDLSALWNAPEDRLMLRERCAQSLLNAACDVQVSDERIPPDVAGSPYIAETAILYRALNRILRDEQCFRDQQREVIDHTSRLAQRQ
jgi:hypothetical protein